MIRNVPKKFRECQPRSLINCYDCIICDVWRCKNTRQKKKNSEVFQSITKWGMMCLSEVSIPSWDWMTSLQWVHQCTADHRVTTCVTDASLLHQSPSQSPPSGCCHQNNSKLPNRLIQEKYPLDSYIFDFHFTKTIKCLLAISSTQIQLTDVFSASSNQPILLFRVAYIW